MCSKLDSFAIAATRPFSHVATMYSPAELFDLAQTEHAALFDGVTHSWEVLRKLADYCRTQAKPVQLHRAIGPVHIGPNVQIGEGTVLEGGVMIVGPAIIGRNSILRHNAYIRENAIRRVGNQVGLGGDQFRDQRRLNSRRITEVPARRRHTRTHRRATARG